MTDADLVEKKLAQIETCVMQLRTMANLARIDDDVREERFIEHTLQMAIQATLDVASHVVSDERLGEPRSHRETFALLERAGWIAPAQSRPLQAMAGFRNILVHAYDEVDLRIVREIVETHLGDLEIFVDAVRRRLGGGG